MAVVTRTKANVRPLEGAVIRRGTAGATIEAGEVVYLDGTNGWKPADANVSAAATLARGIAVAPADIVSGDVFDICMWGPVEGYTGMTPGATHWVSDTEGEVDTADSVAGSDKRVGWAETATILFVDMSLTADPA